MFHGRHGRTPLVGPIGGLIQLPASSSVEVTRPARLTKQTSMSGRVTAQRGKPGRREWSVAVNSAYPEHVQVFRQLEAGLFGAGPFVFYDEHAQVNNLLTPAQSMLAPGEWSGGYQGGAGQAGDGTRYLRSLAGGPSSDIRLVQDVPVPSRYPVTVSAYLSTHPATSAVLSVDEVDPEGAVVGTHQASVGAGRHAARAAASFTSSVRAVALRIRVGGALVAVLPAVTLTGRVLPWSDGAGCTTAVFEQLGHSVQKAAPHERARRLSYTTTVHELG